MGYTVDVAKNGVPEIGGYTAEYLEASSPRREQIREYLAEQGVSGAGAAQIAAHRTREDKLTLTREEMRRRHQDMAEAFGNQPQRVIAEAQGRTMDEHQEARLRPAQSAVTFARDGNLEREAVIDERALMRDALKRSLGQAQLDDVRAQIQERIESGELIAMKISVGQSFTTPGMVKLEQENIEYMRSGQGRYEPIAGQRYIGLDKLSNSQHQAVETILASRDQIMGLEGAAGAGKTTSLAAVRKAAEKSGYTVEGFAPTSRAAYQLEEAGIRSMTLQHHLAQKEPSGAGGKHLYFVDESSLASTRQVHEFFQRLKEDDRVVLVGDVRQHQAGDAGRPYEQLQQAGMQTARLDEILRQKDPAMHREWNSTAPFTMNCKSAAGSPPKNRQ